MFSSLPCSLNQTPLHQSVYSGHVSIAEQLVAAGAAIDAVEKVRSVCLHSTSSFTNRIALFEGISVG